MIGRFIQMASASLTCSISGSLTRCFPTPISQKNNSAYLENLNVFMMLKVVVEFMGSIRRDGPITSPVLVSITFIDLLIIVHRMSLRTIILGATNMSIM
jgi:hypothetical protein